MADNIGLIAQQSYMQIQDRPINTENNPIDAAATFHKKVEKQFNSFANMSPEQRIKTIQGVKQVVGIEQAITQGDNDRAYSNVAAGIVQSIRKPLEQHEQTVRKFLIGKASILELSTTTTESKNAIEVLVKIRDKFIDSFDKVINMSI